MATQDMAMPMPRRLERPMVDMLKDAGITGFVAFALALPLVGFQTVDQASAIVLQTRFPQLFYVTALIFTGRLLLSLCNAGAARPVMMATGAFSALWIVNQFVDVVVVSWQTLNFLTFMTSTVVALRAWILLRRRAVALTESGKDMMGERIAVTVNRFARWLGPFIAAFAVALPFMPFADQRTMDIGIAVLTYVMLGWGLNVVVGLAGLLDLGFVAFYAVGAYSFALLSKELGFNFWEALPLAGGMAASFGIMLGFPVLRLRGDYLAIVTLGFGEMIRLILLNWSDLSNGARGIGDIPRPSFF